jgi:hypothetical protein
LKIQEWVAATNRVAEPSAKPYDARGYRRTHFRVRGFIDGELPEQTHLLVAAPRFDLGCGDSQIPEHALLDVHFRRIFVGLAGLWLGVVCIGLRSGRLSRLPATNEAEANSKRKGK